MKHKPTPRTPWQRLALRAHRRAQKQAAWEAAKAAAISEAIARLPDKPDRQAARSLYYDLDQAIARDD